MSNDVKNGSIARSLEFTERLEVAQQVAGFLPTTRPEHTEVLGILSVDEQLGGSAKHLAEVAMHQSKTKMKDPSRTTRKLVRDYISYGFDAAKGWTNLNYLKEQLDGTNPELNLEAAEVGPFLPGFLEFLRFVDLSGLKNNNKHDSVGYDPMKVKYDVSNGGITAFAELRIVNWSVRNITKDIDMAIDDQANRHEFFLRRLEEVSRHYPSLTNIANEGAIVILNPPEVE